MTAIVGILNRRGVVFAADSAATHKSAAGYKISNNANKIFSLSKYHPVGVALYNNLDFMGVPWDSIIKQFRSSQREKKYDTLQGYIKPFFTFIKSYCLNIVVQQQLEYAGIIINSYCQEVNKLVVNEVGPLTDANAEPFFHKALSVMDETYNKLKGDRAEDFVNYKQADFEEYTKGIVDNALLSISLHPKYPAELRKKFCDSLFALICHKSHIFLDNIYSGLVFFGYGDKDLFPSLLEYKVTYAIGGRVKYTLQQKYEIGPNAYNSLVIPFAQTDVANTVVRAVDDRLRQKFYENFALTLGGFKEEIVNKLTGAKAPEKFIEIFKNLDINKYSTDYQKGMDDFILQSYVNPLLETVTFLDKEDLADMAESLVRMTCLKRHVTTDEETVGGPVDVAIVTKGDGFIWKKRKHYFDAELNTQFFERYNK